MINMIPKKIHYCWFGGKPLPNDVKKCIKSWKKFCPDYEIIEWNESNFDINCCKFVKDAYEHKAWAFVSDYARLKIIYDNGGIYLDTDVEIVRKLDELLVNECYFGQQQDGKYIATGLGFGSVKKAKILKEMLDVYDSIIYDDNNRENIACPILNTKNIIEYGNYSSEDITYLDETKITIYPPKYFDPIAPGNSKNLLCDETYSIHHYSATWMNKNDRLKRKIIRFIGQNKINNIKKILKGNGKKW